MRFWALRGLLAKFFYLTRLEKLLQSSKYTYINYENRFWGVGGANVIQAEAGLKVETQDVGAG